MARRRAAFVAALMCSLFALWVVPAFAQFTANIQGVVQDPSGAGVAKAQIDLVNTGTGVNSLRLLIPLAITAS